MFYAVKLMLCPNSISSSETVSDNEGVATFISNYNIPKMDCSAEEQMVRMTLSSLVNVKRLVLICRIET